MTPLVVTFARTGPYSGSMPYDENPANDKAAIAINAVKGGGGWDGSGGTSAGAGGSSGTGGWSGSGGTQPQSTGGNGTAGTAGTGGALLLVLRRRYVTRRTR